MPKSSMMSKGTAANDVHELFAFAGRRSIGEIVEQHVRFAIMHAIALHNGRLSDGLREMTLTCAAWPEKQCVFVFRDEVAGGEIKDQAAIHLGIESEIEVVECAMRIAKGRLFAAAFEQAVGTRSEFVGDETRDEIDGSHGFGLRLAQTCFECMRHAAETELTQSVLQFSDVHDCSSSLVCPLFFLQ